MPHFDRHRQIGDAQRLFWNDHHDTYSAELWVSLLDAQDVARANMEPVKIVFGGKVHVVMLTDVEDLLALLRKARIAIARARQGMTENAGT